MTGYFVLGILCGIVIENLSRKIGKKIADKIREKRAKRMHADEPESEVKNE